MSWNSIFNLSLLKLLGKYLSYSEILSNYNENLSNERSCVQYFRKIIYYSHKFNIASILNGTKSFKLIVSRRLINVLLINDNYQ